MCYAPKAMPRRNPVTEGPTTYTTFQVARLLRVSAPTVVNWVTAGLLEAFRTPGGHRRIRREDLLAFARARSFPLVEELLDHAPPAVITHRVLIVDDEPEFCELVRTYLRARGGWEVELAHSGFAAGLTIARFKPDVVLMDILMPDMDGFEVLKMMMGDAEMREIPVVACTAWRDPTVEARVAREPFRAAVQKPVKLDHLAAVLESAIATVSVGAFA